MYVGIDVGGTNTRIVTSNSLDVVRFEKRVEFATSQGFNTGLQDIIGAIKDFDVSVDAIGVGLPGSISKEGILDGSANLQQWVGEPLKQELEEAFNCRVFIKNDAEMGALGEACYGGLREKDFFYLTWGTGLGCAQIMWQSGTAKVNRPVDRQPVYDFEALVGGKNIESRFNKTAKTFVTAEWSQVMDDFARLAPKVVTGYGFDTVVVGGGIAVRQKDALTKILKDTNVRAMVTSLEGQAGLYGALAAIKQSE